MVQRPGFSHDTMSSMKVRNYLQSLWKTVTSPIYYLDILNSPIRFSIRFFLVSYFLLALLSTAFYVKFDIPQYQASVDRTLTALNQYFPSDLALKWNEKVLTTTPQRPIKVSYPEGLPHDRLPENFAVIDTSITSSDQIAQLNPYSVVVIGKDKLFSLNSTNTWTSMPLSEVGIKGSFTIDKQNLPNFIQIWSDASISLLQFFAFIYPFFYFFGMGTIRLFGAAVISSFIFILLFLIRKTLPYHKVFQISLHVAIVSEFVNILTNHLISPKEMDMYGLTFWLYFIVVLFSLWNVKSVLLMRVPKKD